MAEVDSRDVSLQLPDEPQKNIETFVLVESNQDMEQLQFYKFPRGYIGEKTTIGKFDIPVAEKIVNKLLKLGCVLAGSSVCISYYDNYSADWERDLRSRDDSIYRPKHQRKWGNVDFDLYINFSN